MQWLLNGNQNKGDSMVEILTYYIIIPVVTLTVSYWIVTLNSLTYKWRHKRR